MDPRLHASASNGNLAPMSIVRRNLLLYWTTQVVAWTGYMLLLGLPTWMEGSFTATFGLVTLAMVAIGIASSHALRLFFKEWHWLDMSVDKLLLRMVLGTLVLGAVAGLLQAAMHDAAFPAADPLIGGYTRRPRRTPPPKNVRIGALSEPSRAQFGVGPPPFPSRVRCVRGRGRRGTARRPTRRR